MNASFLPHCLDNLYHLNIAFSYRYMISKYNDIAGGQQQNCRGNSDCQDKECPQWTEGGECSGDCGRL